MQADHYSRPNQLEHSVKQTYIRITYIQYRSAQRLT